MSTGETFMDIDSQGYKEKLYKQISDAYGKVVYTYTTQLYQAGIDAELSKNLKRWQIGLSAVTSAGFFTTVLTGWSCLNWVNAFVSTVLLGLSAYITSTNLDSKSQRHIQTANRLWLVREKYIALLTDLHNLDSAQVIEERDRLTSEVADIYAVAPLTSSDAYCKARKALKENEEQYFSQEELNKMLPAHLRKRT